MTVMAKFYQFILPLYAEYIMRNAGLEETQTEMKIAGRNNNLRYADDTTLMAESEEELKRLLMKVKVESEKRLKARHTENEDHGIWSHRFMGTRWGNSGNSHSSILTWRIPSTEEPGGLQSMGLQKRHD